MKKRLHPPYNKLKGALREKNLTYRDIAEKLEISEVAVHHKINGVSDFYIGEAKKIMLSFGFSREIFFDSFVS